MRDALPRAIRWILRLAAGGEHGDAILADLAEEADARARTEGMKETRRWYRRQAIASTPPLLKRRLEIVAAQVRRTSMIGWRGFGSDLTAAARRLRETPGFTVVCVLTLALGIGGNTAVFTLVDRVLLKPLPVPRPSELYRIGDTDACCVNSGLQGSFSLFSFDLYEHLREAAPQFTELAAFQASTRHVTIGHPEGDAPPETLNSAFVSGNYFEMFELVPAAGRLLQPADDERGAAAVAVLSYNAWTQRFQGHSDVIGRKVTLNGVPATIVGVAQRGFYGEMLRPDPPQIWIPLANEPQLQPAARLLDAKPLHWLYIIGRVKRGTEIPPIESQLTAALHQWLGTIDLSRERGSISQQRITVISAAAGVDNMRNAVAPTLRMLQLLAAAVLVIACANLASLLLARGTARRTETAVRVALGASRARLIGQFLIESLLLAVAGGIAGLVVSYAGARLIIALAFRGATDIPVDPTASFAVLAFAIAASVATAALVGIVPAIVGSRANPNDALRGTSRTTTDRGGRMRASLIALQVALSLVLVSCAGLLGRSLRNLEMQNFGVAIDNRYVVALAPSLATVPPEELPALYARMQERLTQVPGVANAAFSLYAPMSGDNWSTRIAVEGMNATEPAFASWNRVSPRYFDTVGTPLLRGRAFTERDRAGSPLVTIVSQSMARKYFGAADPIGKRIGQIVPEIEIVGVVADAKYQDGRGAAREMFFLPYLQETSTSRARAVAAGVRIDRSQYPQAIELQTTGTVPRLERDVRRALAEIDRRITVRSVVSMQEQVARAFNLERLIARLTIVFGAVALLLACLGLYGVTAYSVARRTREIGVRMAIGASRGVVLRTIMRSAAVQVLVGVAIGLPLTFVAGRLLAARLFGIVPGDPLVISAGLGVLAAATTVATLLPAARAAGMDPVKALRLE
jgi:predicted permease